MGKKNKINKTKIVEVSKNILSESKEEKELRRTKHKLEELKRDYDKKIKKLEKEKEDNHKLLKEKYSEFKFKPKRDNELEILNNKKKSKQKNNNVFMETKNILNIKFEIPKYKLPEVGVLYENKGKFYLAITDYDELEKANEIAEDRYNNAKVVVTF